MAKNDDCIIRYSEGRGLNLGKAKNKALPLKLFRKLFEKPMKTKETVRQYAKMTVDQQVGLKAIDGWIYRTQVEKGQNRNAHSGKPSDMITLDLDYATPDFLDRMDAGCVAASLEYFAHSTRRHTVEKPRLRVMIPTSRPVTNEEYGPVARIVTFMKFDPDMKMVDKVSFRPAQMMFKPTASSDGDWFFYASHGELLDVDALLEEFNENVGDWTNIENLPKAEGEILREHAEKAEDPTEKLGPVGDFCRAYDVISAIDELDLPYTASDDHSAKPRYTYTGGTTTNGAVVEDGGLFLYSHHGTDPCADMLVNAYDLVRIHKFGHLDLKVDDDVKVGDRPSTKAMSDYIQTLPKYKKSQAESKYDQTAMFDDVMDNYFDEDEPEDDEDLVGDPAKAKRGSDENFQDDIDELVGDPKQKAGSGAASAADRPPGWGKNKKPPKDWFPDQLKLDRQGNIVQNLPNAQTITNNDVRLFRAIAFDECMNRIVALRDIKSNMPTVPSITCKDKVRGDLWEDRHDLAVRAILAAANGKGKGGYGLDKLAERDLAGAVALAAALNSFDPLKDYLWRCEDIGWDGVKRADQIFIKYLGCPDTKYHRMAALMVGLASVTRGFEPGHKFDFAPVLGGVGGRGKSLFIQTLYGKENFGDLNVDMSHTQKVAETIAGLWAVEFAEMTSFHKSDYNEAKRFLSAESDTVRMAYDRRPTVFPRRVVFWGTTNDNRYLKDPTGNRRWWPITVKNEQIDIAGLAANRDQIWAELMVLYKEMRAEQPTGTLPLFLSDPEADAEAVVLQEAARTETLYENWIERAQDWLDEPLPLHALKASAGDNTFDANGDRLMIRCAFRKEDFEAAILKADRAPQSEITNTNLGKAIDHLPGWSYPPKTDTRPGNQRSYSFGKQAAWVYRDDATPEERRLGYREIEEDLI